MALMTIESRRPNPTPADVARQLGVAEADVDASYGVVPIDPDRGLYAAMVRADRVKPQRKGEGPYQGPFSNPRIESFGPRR